MSARWARLCGIAVLSCSLGACASMRRHNAEEAETAATDESGAPSAESAKQEQLSEIRGMLSNMSARLDAMESKLTNVHEKVDPSVKPTGAAATHAEAGLPVNSVTAASDPEAGFVNDEAVRTFRKAMIFFDAGKMAEASLTFSSFVERFPDHALAGQAQYYVAESAFQQKDYAQAQKDFQRVLTSYDRSSHVSHALARLAQIEDANKQAREAAAHRQLLTSLFPTSPAMAMSADRVETPARPAAPAAVRRDTHDTVPAETESKPAAAAAHEDAMPAEDSAPSAPAGFDPPPTAPMESPAPAADDDSSEEHEQ